MSKIRGSVCCTQTYLVNFFCFVKHIINTFQQIERAFYYLCQLIFCSNVTESLNANPKILCFKIKFSLKNINLRANIEICFVQLNMILKVNVRISMHFVIVFRIRYDFYSHERIIWNILEPWKFLLHFLNSIYNSNSKRMKSIILNSNFWFRLNHAIHKK
jgi:hypothetical protein